MAAGIVHEARHLSGSRVRLVWDGGSKALAALFQTLQYLKERDERQEKNSSKYLLIRSRKCRWTWNGPGMELHLQSDQLLGCRSYKRMTILSNT